jgi:hypothetical protein
MFHRSSIALGIGLIASVAGASHGALIAYYPFNGNALDASGNGLHAITVDATQTAGFSGGAYLFDGSNDGIELPFDMNPSVVPQLTMGAWVKTNGTGFSRQGILGNDNGGFDRTLGFDGREGLAAENPTKTFAAFGGDSVGVVNSNSVGSGENEWTFLAVVYDGVNVTLYVNDEPAVIGADDTASGSGLTTTWVGVNRFAPAFETFGGAIDEVFFFSTALSADEIGRIRENGVPAPGAVGLLAVAMAGPALRRPRRAV